MSSAVLTSPPKAAARLVVDTDVASFIFKWHPVFAPRYLSIIRGAELIVSFDGWFGTQRKFKGMLDGSEASLTVSPRFIEPPHNQQPWKRRSGELPRIRNGKSARLHGFCPSHALTRS